MNNQGNRVAILPLGIWRPCPFPANRVGVGDPSSARSVRIHVIHLKKIETGLKNIYP